MKRIISIILSAAIACSALPLSALAAEGDILYPAGTVIDEDAEILAAVLAAADADYTLSDVDDPEFALTDTERTYETLAEKPELTDDEKLEVVEMLIAAQNEETATDYPVTMSASDDIKLLYRTDKELAVTYVAGYEYSIDSGATWNTTGVFTNLTNGAEYTVTVRDKVTLETVCSLFVASALKPKAPKRPTATGIDRTSITIKTESGAEYSIDNGSTWRTDGIFTDLKPGTEYTIISRYSETGSALASESSDPLTVTTVPADTYVVSDEAELLSALAEISTLQATKPRVNVRFKNDITISDTLVIPRLKGRMTVYLDLYGFTLKCSKRDVPVVEINTRATLGSSYYLNSGVSSEEIRGGNIAATGTGCGIDIGAGAIVTLNGLTFNCDTAIVSSGEVESLENIHGKIKNSGYIGEITGTELTVSTADDWAIYNEGTIESITNCTLTDKTTNSLWRGEYDSSLTGIIHNLGYIGTVDATKITTYRPAAVVNAAGAEIGNMADNSIANNNYYRGVVCLNFGTIDEISDGNYSAWNCDFINAGTISSITGGYFNTNSDSAETVEKKISADNFAFLQTTNDTYACFDNLGSINIVSGGVYYGGYTTFGRGYWYPDGTRATQENCGENNRSWIDYMAFKSSAGASLNFADGYGMSRSMHKYKDYGSGYKVDKLYKVAYDMTEAKCYLKADGSVTPSALVIEDNGAEALSAPDYLYYCEGDTVYRNNPFARGYYGSTESGWLRIVKGQYPDYGKKTQYCKVDNGTAIYENKYLADVMYDSVYYLTSLTGSDEVMNSYSFKMPAKDVTYTPNWGYRQPGYKGFANSRLGYQEAYRSAANTVLVNADFEVDLENSESGIICTVTAHSLDDFLAFAAGTTPVSGFGDFTDSSRPYHYEWSLDKENWHRDDESVAITADMATVYLRIVANSDTYDASANVASSKLFAVQIISLDLDSTDNAPNGSTVMLTGKNEVTITAALGTATQKGDGIEVQVALEDEQGNITPYDLGSDSITYHSDIARPTQGLVLGNIPDKSKVKARFRQYTLGYRHLENPTSNGDVWTLGYVSAWSDWQSVTAKADVAAPLTAPELIKRLDTSIIVKAEDGLEYSIDNGSTWQNGGEFVSLTPDTEYSIVSRVAETDLTNASPNSPALTVRTRLTDGVLTAPVLESKTDTSVTVESKEGCEYSIDGGNTWQTNGTFTGLTFGTEYDIICRREDEPEYTSPALTVKTVFPAPVLVKRTDTSITVDTKDGLEYSIDNGSTWQLDGEFTGLTAGTRYEIVARRENDTDTVSGPLIVATKTVQGSPSEPPMLISKTDTTITVEADPDMEYSIDGGSTWQKDGTFTGLSEGTEYEIISRFTETDDSAASAPSEPLVVTTKTYPTAEIVPPNILSVSVTSISVEPETDQEYAVYTAEDDTFVQGWYTDGEFNGLTGDTKYKVVTRICETEDTVASDIGTAVVLVNTDKRHYSSAPDTDDTETVIPADLHYAYVYGFPDGTLRPGKFITRAEAVAVLARAFPQAAALDLDTQYFTDVNEGAWYFEQVQLMATLGIAKGYSDGTFKPNEPITRAEFVTLASRFKAVADNGSSIDFTDTYTNWPKDSITAMSSEGYINGYADGTFKPNNNITRAEAITVVYRMVGSDCEKSREKRVWPDCNDTSMWYYKAVMEASVTHESENKEDNNES